MVNFTTASFTMLQNQLMSMILRSGIHKLVDISTTVFTYSRAVQYHMILHGCYCTGLEAIYARYPSNQGVLQLEPVHLNSELLGTLCEKRHDAVVVTDNKYFITLISVHITVIAR